MFDKHGAMEEIYEKLKSAGCSDLEVNILLARFLEEEAEEYIALKQVVKESGIINISKALEDNPELLEDLAEEICDWMDDQDTSRKYS